jgi:hypothetical protein
MHLLSGGFTPVAEVRHGKSSYVLDQRGNQHGLVSRQHSLADRNMLAALILRAHGTRAILAIRLVGERLLDLTVLVAIKTAILAHAALSGSSRRHGASDEKNSPWTWGTNTRSLRGPTASTLGREDKRTGSNCQARRAGRGSLPNRRSSCSESQRPNQHRWETGTSLLSSPMALQLPQRSGRRRVHVSSGVDAHAWMPRRWRRTTAAQMRRKPCRISS